VADQSSQQWPHRLAAGAARRAERDQPSGRRLAL